jgi:hypothetical protein
LRTVVPTATVVVEPSAILGIVNPEFGPVNEIIVYCVFVYYVSSSRLEKFVPDGLISIFFYKDGQIIFY